jgi:hypothetical protein
VQPKPSKPAGRSIHGLHRLQWLPFAVSGLVQVERQMPSARWGGERAGHRPQSHQAQSGPTSVISLAAAPHSDRRGAPSQPNPRFHDCSLAGGRPVCLEEGQSRHRGLGMRDDEKKRRPISRTRNLQAPRSKPHCGLAMRSCYSPASSANGVPMVGVGGGAARRQDA